LFNTGKIPEDLREELEDAVKAVTTFFIGLNIRPRVSQPQVDKDGSLYVRVDFGKSLKIPELYYEWFTDLLSELGFYHANETERDFGRFILTKKCITYEEYRHRFKDVAVLTKYYVHKIRKSVLYLDYIIVRVEAPHQEVVTP
jgi:hypothetical protein